MIVKKIVKINDDIEYQLVYSDANLMLERNGKYYESVTVPFGFYDQEYNETDILIEDFYK